MVRRPAAVLVALLLCCLAIPAVVSETGQVARIVDGDTLEVVIGGRVEKVRLIGVDTPETVHPQKPVELFGKEASAFTKRMAEGQIVRLEGEPQVGERDKYGRLLRYVFLPDGRLLNAEIIARGYGHAYTRFPFSRMEEFRGLERTAREGNRGLWGPAGDAAGPRLEESASTAAPQVSPDPGETVYGTRTGTKYHQAGCRYLAKSAIPMPLKEAAARYGACSVCSPPRLKGGAPQAATTGPGEGLTAAPNVVVEVARKNVPE